MGIKRALVTELESCEECPHHCILLRDDQALIHYCAINEFNQCSDSADADRMLFINCTLEKVIDN